MMRAAAGWVACLAASAAVHAAAAVLVVPAYAPQQTEQQPLPPSKLQLDTVETPTAAASERQPDSESAAEAQAEATSLASGVVARSQAAAVAPQVSAVAPAAVIGTRAAAAALPAQSTTSTPPKGDTLAAGAPTLTAAVASQATAEPATLAALPATDVPTAQPAVTQAAQPPLPADRATATTAWNFGDRLVTDPKAIATIQAFLAPEALDNAAANAGQVRDGLGAVLTGVDCARLSATFIPETGLLEIRGHVPDLALQDQIIAAMQAQVGEGIGLSANLLHLPKPQCGALTGISAVGLPQSTDQFTNDRLVGATSHARAYSYSEGQRLQFDLAAPDYDAFVYVDYFNADGEVIHLVPNEIEVLEKHPAQAVVGIGTDRADRPGLKITIGPPFGQEIAVAFAASHPLYDGLHPISEPAGPYLEFLRDRVEATRSAHPDFKGEWVYFFINTAP